MRSVEIEERSPLRGKQEWRFEARLRSKSAAPLRGRQEWRFEARLRSKSAAKSGYATNTLIEDSASSDALRTSGVVRGQATRDLGKHEWLGLMGSRKRMLSLCENGRLQSLGGAR